MKQRRFIYKYWPCSVFFNKKPFYSNIYFMYLSNYIIGYFILFAKSFIKYN